MRSTLYFRFILHHRAVLLIALLPCLRSGHLADASEACTQCHALQIEYSLKCAWPGAVLQGLSTNVGCISAVYLRSIGLENSSHLTVNFDCLTDGPGPKLCIDPDCSICRNHSISVLKGLKLFLSDAGPVGTRRHRRDRADAHSVCCNRTRFIRL